MQGFELRVLSQNLHSSVIDQMMTIPLYTYNTLDTVNFTHFMHGSIMSPGSKCCCVHLAIRLQWSQDTFEF